MAGIFLNGRSMKKIQFSLNVYKVKLIWKVLLLLGKEFKYSSTVGRT